MEIDRHVRNAGIWGRRKNLTAVLLGILLLAAACLGGCRNSQDMFVRIPEESLPAGQESSQAESPETGMEPGTTETSDTKPSEEITQESENPPQKETNVPAASGTQELNGSIQSVGSYGFTVYQIFKEKQEDGGMIAYSSKEKGTLVDVSFTERTVFTVTSSSDRGITSSSAPGTKADLEVSRSTYMTGMWEGNIFIADTVTIYHFD